MLAGLASPSHLIFILVLVLLLFGAKRIPELAKSLGTGLKEVREGIASGDDATAKTSKDADVYVGAHGGTYGGVSGEPEDATVRSGREGH